MKDDGNGGYVIQKGTFALIMAVIALLSCVSTVIAYGVTMNSDINALEDKYEQVAADHKPWAEAVDNKIGELEKAQVAETIILQDIHDDIKEIKTDLKQHIREAIKT